MSHEKSDIDVNRRNFIKASLVLAGAFVLGKISGLLSLTSAISPPARTPPIGIKEYKNARYGFSLRHPSDLAVSTFNEGGGAATITFQNAEKAEGFQIFITPCTEPHAGEVPYNGINGTQAGDQRSKQDEPSGVRKSLKTILIDGAIAAAFYSENTMLGATREVRVVHGGFLYELTTHKSLDAWFDEIMQTWKFV